MRGRGERPPQPDDAVVGPGDDLAGIRADDALLDALGGRDTEQADALVEDELNALLLAWRREVDSRPVGELVDTDTAVATIAAARPQQRGRHRFLIPLASAAAVLAIAFTGMSLVARDAQPGDTLWGLTRVLYSDHARSVEAAVTVKGDLGRATAALREGRYDEAGEILDKAGEILKSVSDDDKGDLTQTHESLKQMLESTEQTPTGTPPSPALSTQPVAPVPSADLPVQTTVPAESTTTTPVVQPEETTTTTVSPDPQPTGGSSGDPTGGTGGTRGETESPGNSGQSPGEAGTQDVPEN
ncbi:anti-sigma-D factor RsdA [Saccharothrix sp. Mg75]|uniref:anti-sigma-D factor RsdA n=1 Tax=Saccharothrix sp. Mg75 TaxID=3445357 RepID=UPI003EEEF85E